MGGTCTAAWCMRSFRDPGDKSCQEPQQPQGLSPPGFEWPWHLPGHAPQDIRHDDAERRQSRSQDIPFTGHREVSSAKSLRDQH